MVSLQKSISDVLSALQVTVSVSSAGRRYSSSALSDWTGGAGGGVGTGGAVRDTPSSKVLPIWILLGV